MRGTRSLHVCLCGWACVLKRLELPTAAPANQPGCACAPLHTRVDACVPHAHTPWLGAGVDTSQEDPSRVATEAEVYMQHAEGLLGRIVSTYSAALLPTAMSTFHARAAAFSAATQQLAATGGGGALGALSASESMALLVTCADTGTALRLLRRCAPFLPAPSAGMQLSVGGGGTAVIERMDAAGTYAALHTLLALCEQWIRGAQAMCAGVGGVAQGAAGMPAVLTSWLELGRDAYKALGAFSATWLTQAMMTRSICGIDDAHATELVGAVFRPAAAGASFALQASGERRAPPGTQNEVPGLVGVGCAAAECLVSLSSVVLSAAAKPPPHLLHSLLESGALGELHGAACAHLASGHTSFVKPLQAVWVCVSDLSLRCWAAAGAGAAAADRERLTAQAGALLGPLVEAVGKVGQLAGRGAFPAVGADAACQVCWLGAHTLGYVIQSYAGSNKATRAALHAAVAAHALAPTLASLRAARAALLSSAEGERGGDGAAGRAASALLRLLSTVLQVLPTELPPAAVEKLLGDVVDAFGAGEHALMGRGSKSARNVPACRQLLLPFGGAQNSQGEEVHAPHVHESLQLQAPPPSPPSSPPSGTDPSLASELSLLRLILSATTHGGATATRLSNPALAYCISVLDRCSGPQSAVADVPHVQAETLAAAICVLRHHWKAFAAANPSGLQQQQGASGSRGPGGGVPIALLASQAARSASAAGSERGAATASPAVVAVSERLASFLEGMGPGCGVVLAAADVRLLLQELYDLHVRVKGGVVRE